MIKILYLEPDLQDYSVLAPKIEKLFSLAGFSAVVSSVANVQNAQEQIRVGACDVFICDLSMMKTATENFEGLAIVAAIKAEFPYIFVIGTTGGFPRHGIVDVREPSFDLFLSKIVVRSENFAGEPDYAARLAARFCPLPRINVRLAEPIVTRNEMGTPTPGEVEVLVRQLFSASGPLTDACYPNEVTLKALNGGRSPSYVFAMEGTHTDPGRDYLRSVVKISPIGDFVQELERFQKYVKWSLPYTARVDILGTGVTKDWGAIAYSFAHGGLKEFDTLTALLQKKDGARASRAIAATLAAADSLWGSVANPDPGRTIRDRYSERYFGGEHKWFEMNNGAMQGAAQTAGHSIDLQKDWMSVNNENYPNILNVLESGGAYKDGWSISHGDLNTSNVVVTRDGAIAFIDFRDAGIGHIFEDLITLEGCIRLYWDWPSALNQPALLKACLAQEREFNKSGGLLDKGAPWKLIANIRTHAFAKFGDELKKSYYYGLAYYCFRLLRLHDLRKEAVTRLLATMLAASEMVSPLAGAAPVGAPPAAPARKFTRARRQMTKRR